MQLRQHDQLKIRAKDIVVMQENPRLNTSRFEIAALHYVVDGVGFVVDSPKLSLSVPVIQASRIFKIIAAQH